MDTFWYGNFFWLLLSRKVLYNKTKLSYLHKLSKPSFPLESLRSSLCVLSVTLLSFLGKVSNYHSGRWMLCLFNTYRGYNTIKEQIRKKAHLKNMSVFYASKLRKTSLLLRLRADPSQWTPPIGNIHSFSQIAITIEPMLQLLYSLRFRISKTCAL